MGSRREEERNEKIIRGLMKLPPNRRCINCNSLGPQYVCTNFLTFICMACSGIHREFTHRVKSVSMAKFTSQEVEALQNGGNQRARELYLKNWDPQRQRLPDSSNVDKVREFIKNVYVEMKYAGGKTSDKPPRDRQTHSSSEDVTRRASSYHSYSQSPPYDYQYEERRYGKQASGFTSKSGSYRGLFGKASSFVDSPGRFSDHMFEDRFANEGSNSRASDFSVSSAGDPFRSGTQSPNFQKENGFNSPPFQSSKDQNVQQTTNLFPGGQPQRSTSFGSVRSFDSNSMSTKSYNSGTLAEAFTESEQNAWFNQDKSSTRPPSSAYGGLDLFSQPVVSKADTTKASPIDLFQLPEARAAPSANTFQPSGSPAAPSTNTFQLSTVTKAPFANSYQPPQTHPPPSIDLFAGVANKQPNVQPPEMSVHDNEGWATFDSQPVAPLVAEVKVSSEIPRDVDSSVKLEGVSLFNTSMQWPAYQSSSVDQPSPSISSPWHEGLSGVPAPTVVGSTQAWNAFEDSVNNTPLGTVTQFSEIPGVASNPSSTADQHLGLRVLEDSGDNGIHGAMTHGDPTVFGLLTNIATTLSHTPSMVPEDAWPHAKELKSSNPFDFPFDSELDSSDAFLEMSSLQAALPNVQPPPTFLSGVSQPWFPPDPVNNYVPTSAGSQGGLAFMVGQAPTSQLPNVPTQGPVASIGGNPFA